MIDLGIYRLSDDVQLPKYGTSLSTCFDLRYCPTNKIVNGYDGDNFAVERYVGNDKSLWVFPGDRLLVPTGIIMKISTSASIESFADITTEREELNQFSIRLHARSGMALKRGLVLANAEGIVDVDYQNEVFILITNISRVTQSIEYQERIAQAEVVTNKNIRIIKLSDVPSPHSDRSGGFGSTGSS